MDITVPAPLPSMPRRREIPWFPASASAFPLVLVAAPLKFAKAEPTTLPWPTTSIDEVLMPTTASAEELPVAVLVDEMAVLTSSAWARPRNAVVASSGGGEKAVKVRNSVGI
jgi:hypothetical protein